MIEVDDPDSDELSTAELEPVEIVQTDKEPDEVIGRAATLDDALRAFPQLLEVCWDTSIRSPFVDILSALMLAGPAAWGDTGPTQTSFQFDLDEEEWEVDIRQLDSFETIVSMGTSYGGVSVSRIGNWYMYEVVDSDPVWEYVQQVEDPHSTALSYIAGPDMWPSGEELSIASTYLDASDPDVVRILREDACRIYGDVSLNGTTIPPSD